MPSRPFSFVWPQSTFPGLELRTHRWEKLFVVSERIGTSGGFLFAVPALGLGGVSFRYCSIATSASSWRF